MIYLPGQDESINRLLLLREMAGQTAKDLDNNFNFKTRVRYYVEGTNELIYEGTNKVILPGAGFIARKLFNLYGYNEITPSYNTELKLDNTLYTDPTSPHQTFLFCMGTDGCGKENSEVAEEQYGKWIIPEALVPFRYPLKQKDITEDMRKYLYFGRKTLSDHYAYYFKRFEADPMFIQQYIDGTPIDSTVYNNNNPNDIETFVEIRMKVTKDDFREYFYYTTGMNDARVNCLSLLTAWYTEIGGYRVYQDVRPLTRINFPNEPLIDKLKGIDIVYQVYF